MSRSKASYHHGDLRNALIAAGVKLLADEGMAGLSLRKLARAVGVSHNAPYMHFPDKEAVLAAIAEQGFQLLGAAVDAGQQRVANAAMQTRLVAVAQSYVQFARTYPNHLQVMFGPLAADTYPELARTAQATFARLVQIMREGQQRGELKDGAADQLALLLWMNVHGLSTLLIAGKIPPNALGGQSVDDVTALSVRMLCDGILAA